MKGWLKYLLPVIVVVAFWNCTEEPARSVSEVTVADDSIHNSSYLSIVSESESEPCLPRQITFSKTYRTSGVARRTTNVHRSNLEFIKAGRTINTTLRYFIQLNSINSYSSLTEPRQKLHCLGRLII